MGKWGPGGRTRAPIHESAGNVRIIRGKVTAVDKVKWTCSVQGEMDNQQFEGIPIQPTYVNSEGGGQFFMPETNSVTWLCFPSTDSTPFIMGGATVPKQTDEGDLNEDPNDHRQSRPVLNEGDMLVASSGSARIIVRRGGVVEIGASDSARRIYIPLSNLIQEFSQNWTHETGGGKVSMLCRDNDETYGSTRTPTEYQFQWKEFCEDEDPIVDIRMGRIQVEDDERILNAVRGEIVYSFNINNRYKVWIDKQGNSQSVKFGATYDHYVKPRMVRHHQSLSDIVRGTLASEYGVRSTKIARSDLLNIGGGREVNIAEGLIETIGSKVTRKVEGPVDEEVGSVKRTINGENVELILNGEDRTITGTQSVSIGQSQQTTVGTSMKTLVPGAGLLPTGTAWELVVTNGKAVIHNTLGKNVFSVGPTQLAATCKITQKVTGTIELSSGLGVTTVEINATGVNISTVGGAISIDQLGTVQLGPGPVRGNVVTTLTHPIDYMTGAPIFGSANVQAGAVALLPGPAAVPSLFLPDLTP